MENKVKEADPSAGPPRHADRKRSVALSYAQAAAANPAKTLFRKVPYSLGVVVAVHHHKSGAYARIFRDKGEHQSIKITDDTKYGPGDLIRITDTLADGDTRSYIYGIHPQPVDDSRHPLCEGTVKSFDKARQLWNVKVRSVSRYLKVRPGSFPLLRDQTILFIPTLRQGSLAVKKVVDAVGGISTDTLPSWTIPEGLSLRLKKHFPEFSLVDPSTRANDDLVPMLDLDQAVEDLPKSSGTIHQAPYLHLEELMIRQSFPNDTNWADSQAFQTALSDGLSPLLYIHDDDPAKIRKLRRDLRKIQEAGIERTVQILYPAPPMVTADSIKHTMSTQLVNPKRFPVTSILLLDQPSSILMSLGSTQKEVFRRFMVITMCSSGGDEDFPVHLDDQPFDFGASLDAKAREAMLKHNLLVLAEKEDKRLNTLRTRRPPGCRLTVVNHPMRQTYQALQLTFAAPEQVRTYLQANRDCIRPFFMQSATNLHLLKTTITVTTTRLVPCAEWEMSGLGDVYPIHQTKYAVHWAPPDTSLEDHLRAVNTKLQTAGLPPPFLQTLTRTGETTSLMHPRADADPADHDLIDVADQAHEAGKRTLVAAGFPSYAPEQAILDVVAAWTPNENHAELPVIVAQSSNECAAVFTVDNKVASQLVGIHPTPLGPIEVQRREPNAPSHRQQAHRRDSNEASLLELFPPPRVPLPPVEQAINGNVQNQSDAAGRDDDDGKNMDRNSEPAADPASNPDINSPEHEPPSSQDPVHEQGNMNNADNVDADTREMKRAEEMDDGDNTDEEEKVEVNDAARVAAEAGSRPIEPVKSNPSLAPPASRVTATLTESKQLNTKPSPPAQPPTREGNSGRTSSCSSSKASNSDGCITTLIAPKTPGLSATTPASKRRHPTPSPEAIQTHKFLRTELPQPLSIDLEEESKGSEDPEDPDAPGKEDPTLTPSAKPKLITPEGQEPNLVNQTHNDTPDPTSATELPPGSPSSQN